MTKNKEQEKFQIISDNEIDLIALIKTIWNGRKTIYYTVGVAVFIGLIIAFTSPAKYQAYCTLIPSEEKQGGMGNFGALASMAGINIGSMMGGASGISAEVYPQVVNSYPFKKEMMNRKFNFEDYPEQISLYNYYLADTIDSFGDKFLNYTIKLPWTLKDALIDKDEQLKSVDYGVINLSKREIEVLKKIEDLITVDVDSETGLVKVSTEVEEPVLSAQIVKNAEELLQEYVIRYKTKQAREHLEFVQTQHDIKKDQYEKAQEKLFKYKDKHRNVISERVNLEFQRLSDEYDMSSAVFKGLAQQLEQAKIAVNEQTPVFTILEPTIVPYDKSAPKKGLILIVSFFFGIIVGLGRILFLSYRDLFISKC